MRDHGQLVVELALVLPVLIAILGGMAGVGFLWFSQHRMQTGVEILAELASDGTQDWRTKVASEDARTDCNASPAEPTVTYPDGTANDGDRILLVWECHLDSGWLFDGLPITVSAEAVIRAAP
jgi:Flp pilus assembly protein TadG